MRYIDADKLANDIYRAWELWEKKGEDCYIFAEVITPILVGQPTADVKPVVKGEWTRHFTRPNVFKDTFWHCSVCGYKNSDPYAHIYHKYCPNCGADMGKEDE